MDTSEQYIKMCDCPEIQRLSLSYGIRKPNYQSQCGADMSETGDWWHLNIWVPRQDQLQDMVDSVNIGVKLATFTYYVGNEVMGRQRFTSMEQLWLAFVMKEKFGKVWDGEKWA